MELQTLRFFVEAADAGSLSAAAEKLRYAQSNLSNRIKQLEDELGEPLFYRNKRGVTLTAKGQLFYDYATHIIKLANESIQAMQDVNHAQGRLAIGALEAVALKYLPDLFARYHADYPDVTLTLQTDMNDVFQGKVLKRELDGAFVAGPVTHPDLSAVAIATERLVLVGSADAKSNVPETLLAASPLITFPKGSVFRRRFELLLSSLSVDYLHRLNTMNSLGANITNICAGLGLGYLPYSIVKPYIAKGLMREYPLDDPYSELAIVFIHRKDHVMDAAFRFFLGHL